MQARNNDDDDDDGGGGGGGGGGGLVWIGWLVFKGRHFHRK